ncbi:MAG: Fe-S cluster assembly protein HesB [Acidothermaceae bacterium]
MLTMTTEAAQVINALVADQPGGGVRISEVVADGQMQLGLSVAAEPLPSDQIVEKQGSHVFVEDQVVPLLEGKILDASITEDRQVSFSLLP